MRLTSEFWVSALIRRARDQGAFATIIRKGAVEAGAIFIVARRPDAKLSLFGPAPQNFYEEETTPDRAFEELLVQTSDAEVQKKIDRETGFDPDIWVVEIEDREGRSFIENIVTAD